MKTDFDTLASTPPTETEKDGGCYDDAKRYIELIRKVLGKEPAGSQLKPRSNPHDYGSYVTVVYFFDDDVKEHVDYMRRIEDDGPMTWNDETPR